MLISGYLNYEPYYGSVPADKGKRRIDVYNEHLEHVRHVEPDVLNLMMLRTSKPKKVDREGVYLNIRGKKIWYNCPELHSLWQEKKVYLRYDPGRPFQRARIPGRTGPSSDGPPVRTGGEIRSYAGRDCTAAAA